MKKCRTLNGLLKAIRLRERCCLEYTSMSPTRNGYIIYHKNGTNIVVGDETYRTIKPYLKQI